MSDAQRTPYGAWPSPIAADRAAGASVGLRGTRAIGFYGQILSFEPADRLPPLEIVNLPSGGD
jgi:hypothetical protein